MREQLMDVHLELDPLQLAMLHDPTRFIAEASRHTAETKAAESGVSLRHPEPREVVARQAIDPQTGRSVMLIATRWIVDGREQPLGMA